MISRRTFLKKLSALPLVGIIFAGFAERMTIRKHMINRFSVAGFQYYEGPQLLPQMKPGEVLELLAEPENEYDSFAVKIMYQGRHIGYVPRSDNRHISRLLRRRVPLLCRISKIKPQDDPWRRLRVKVWLLENVNGGKPNFPSRV
ncbi:MAG: HIRAN domain-containing protein [Calditrichia bacterium]